MIMGYIVYECEVWLDTARQKPFATSIRRCNFLSEERLKRYVDNARLYRPRACYFFSLKEAKEWERETKKELKTKSFGTLYAKYGLHGG